METHSTPMDEWNVTGRPRVSVKHRVWRILSTLPLTGEANMAFDLKTVEEVGSETEPPTLRFFRFDGPTVSYGRLQTRRQIQSLIPDGWPSVQRPTGGGLVFHDGDICLSLCWKKGQVPLPQKLSDVYAWIHRVIQVALAPLESLRMADCQECPSDKRSSPQRQCFQEPVVFDLLQGSTKIVGGALCRRGNGFLYQGSIQGFSFISLEKTLQRAFENAF